MDKKIREIKSQKSAKLFYLTTNTIHRNQAARRSITSCQPTMLPPPLITVMQWIDGRDQVYIDRPYNVFKEIDS